MNGTTVSPIRRTRADRIHPNGCPCRSCRNRRHTVLVREGLQFLAQQPDFWGWKIQPFIDGMPGRAAPNGIPDICGMLAPRGRWVCFEAKTGKGKLRPSQRAWIAEARKFGALVYEFHSVAELAAALNDARRLTEAR